MKYRIEKRWDKVWGELYVPQMQYKWFPFIWFDLGYCIKSEQQAESLIEKHKEHSK